MLAPPSKARIAAVRRLGRRSVRAELGQFVAEGPQSVREALGAGAVVDLFVAASELERHRGLVDAALAARRLVHLASPSVLDDLSDTSTPQGVLAVCQWSTAALDQVLTPQSRLVVLLAQARDPGNAGTIVRTADAAGADGLVLSAESVDVFNPKSVRASAGSVFHLPLVVDPSVPEVVAAARSAGLRVIAADGAGDTSIDDEIDADRLTGPTLWIFGNEAWGLPDGLLAQADSVVRVPIHGRAESLNLAAAAAVCLYASARAQRTPRSD